jgi:pimeloyl-ACP methyl ester carboxylesterase
MASTDKSTTVRFRDLVLGGFFRAGEHLAPGPAGKVARNLWFTAPPRMKEIELPEGGDAFEVASQGGLVRGHVWGDGPVVYLLHGWGGRGAQFEALVQPLVAAGHRVVLFDAPSHGDSDAGPAGPRRTHGLEFARALDDVFKEFGPAEAVVAHSLGTIATYLTLRFGWLGTKRLVFIAPMVESASLFDQFQGALGFGARTRRAFDRAVDEFVGIQVSEFDARVQATYSDPLPTLVVADQSDWQTPYDDAVDFARSIDAELVTTEGLGHRRILRDAHVVRTVVDYVSQDREGQVVDFVAPERGERELDVSA